MWRGLMLCLVACSDVGTYQPTGPTTLVVGGRAGYGLTRDIGFAGCDPYTKPQICTPDVIVGSPHLSEVTSDDPSVLEIVELYEDIAGIALAHAPGHATLTLTSDDAIEHHVEVDVVAPTRLSIDAIGCGADQPMPVGTQQCVELRAYDGATELAGGGLDAVIDNGPLVPVAIDPSFAAPNTTCYTMPAQPGSTTLTMTFDGLTASRPITYYDLPQTDGLALSTDPDAGPFEVFDNKLFLLRALSLAGQPVCEIDGAVPSKWTTQFTSETPDICAADLYGNATVAGQGTAANVMGIAPGTCHMRVDVGALTQTIDLEFVAMP